MSAAANEHSPVPTTPLRFGARELVILALVGCGSIGLAKLAPELVPLAIAAAVAACVPKTHAWATRAALAVIAAIFALFVVRMWPSVGAIPDVTSPPYEPKTLLSWLIGLPIAGAVAILFLPRQTPELLKNVTLLVMFGTLAASALLLAVPMGRGFHFNQDVAWMPQLGIHYHVAIDGISLWLVLLATLITPIATWASFGPITTRIKDWCFALLLLEGAMIGALVSLDLVAFYIFWELMLIPMYVMIGVWGGSNRI